MQTSSRFVIKLIFALFQPNRKLRKVEKTIRQCGNYPSRGDNYRGNYLCGSRCKRKSRKIKDKSIGSNKHALSLPKLSFFLKITINFSVFGS
jgi:hypothetical protein